VIETKRERLVQWEDPSVSVAAIAALSGLEAWRAIIDGKIAPPPIAALMNMTAVFVEEGRIVFEGEAGEEHYNPIGIVHGGFALTIMDSALGCAVHTMLPAGTTYATTDIQVRMLRPISKATGRVRCEAKVQHVGRTLGVAEATLVDKNGKLLATGTTACAIFARSVA
jgi:uncharacterized protein (TIGR00369 family)